MLQKTPSKLDFFEALLFVTETGFEPATLRVEI